MKAQRDIGVTPEAASAAVFGCALTLLFGAASDAEPAYVFDNVRS